MFSYFYCSSVTKQSPGKKQFVLGNVGTGEGRREAGTSVDLGAYPAPAILAGASVVDSEIPR